MPRVYGHTYPQATETEKENHCCLNSKVQDQSTLTNRMLLCCSEIGASKLGLPRLEVAATFSVIIHGRRVTSTTAKHTQSAYKLQCINKICKNCYAHAKKLQCLAEMTIWTTAQTVICLKVTTFNAKQTNFLLNLVGYYYYDICLTAFFPGQPG